MLPNVLRDARRHSLPPQVQGETLLAPFQREPRGKLRLLRLQRPHAVGEAVATAPPRVLSTTNGQANEAGLEPAWVDGRAGGAGEECLSWVLSEAEVLRSSIMASKCPKCEKTVYFGKSRLAFPSQHLPAWHLMGLFPPAGTSGELLQLKPLSSHQTQALCSCSRWNENPVFLCWQPQSARRVVPSSYPSHGPATVAFPLSSWSCRVRGRSVHDGHRRFR